VQARFQTLANLSPTGAKHAINSIAVLPLDNFSDDPNQEYFADGWPTS
jgi:TolB-like protein